MSVDIHCFLVAPRFFDVIDGRLPPGEQPALVDAVVKADPESFEDAPQALESLREYVAGGRPTRADRMYRERAFRALCEYFARGGGDDFTNAPWAFESEIDGVLRRAGIAREKLSFKRLLATPAAPGLDGRSDWLVTAHEAAEVVEISKLLEGIDFGDSGDFRSIAQSFDAAAHTQRGLVVFTHGFTAAPDTPVRKARRGGGLLGDDPASIEKAVLLALDVAIRMLSAASGSFDMRYDNTFQAAADRYPEISVLFGRHRGGIHPDYHGPAKAAEAGTPGFRIDGERVDGREFLRLAGAKLGAHPDGAAIREEMLALLHETAIARERRFFGLVPARKPLPKLQVVLDEVEALLG